MNILKTKIYLLLLFVNGLNAQTFDFFSSDDGLDSRFGDSVSIFEDWAVVGASLEDTTTTTDTGAVYLFHKSNQWQQQIKLTGQFDGEKFGDFVLIQESKLFIGATGGSAGFVPSVYIYTLIEDMWVFEQRITVPENTQDSNFGKAIAYENQTLFIGAPEQTSSKIKSGVVYIYQKPVDIWEVQGVIQASDAEEDDKFGYAIDVKQDWMVIGAYNKPTNLDRGRAYVYNKIGTQWFEHQQLAANSFNRDRFGYSVAIDERQILIGAPAFIDLTEEERLGKAYLYRLDQTQSNWSEHQQLSALSLFPSFFGWSVKLNDNIAYVSSVLENGSFGNSRSSVYTFFESAGLFSFQQKIFDGNPVLNQLYGHSIAVWDDQFIVGSPGGANGDENNGGAFIYQQNYQLKVSINGLVDAADLLLVGEKNQGVAFYVSFDTSTVVSGDFVRGDEFNFYIAEQPMSPNQRCEADQYEGAFFNDNITITVTCEDIDTIYKSAFE